MSFTQPLSLTTASLKQNEVVNHSLVCLGLAHIYLNQHEALHLWCELIKLTWLSPAWLLQLRSKGSQIRPICLNGRESSPTIRHTTLPSTRAAFQEHQERGFHCCQQLARIPAILSIGVFRRTRILCSQLLCRSLKGLSTNGFPAITFCLTLGTSWQQQICKIHLIFFFSF